MRELILASASTARAKLLREMGIPFRVVVSGVEEDDRPGETVEARAARLARAKAEAVAGRVREGVVLGADSLVELCGEPDGGPLGKPRSVAEAAAMLRRQMGRDTEVVTAVCLIDAATGRREEGVDRSRVRLRPMSDGEIARYAADPRVLTSAGGYLIEDERDPYVALVSGELGTVLGLPVGLTRRLLKALSVS
jgi:septum formation protein